MEGAREPRRMYFRRVVHDCISLSSWGMQEDDNDDTDSKFLNKECAARNPNFDLEASCFDDTTTILGDIDVLPCDFTVVGELICTDRMIVII